MFVDYFAVRNIYFNCYLPSAGIVYITLCSKSTKRLEILLETIAYPFIIEVNEVMLCHSSD